MTTTANMSLVLPTDHGSSDVWGAMLATVFGLVDAHDHTTGKGVQVPSAGLKINADVAWSFSGTSYAITGAKAFDLTPVAASTVTSYSSALFANASDSNNLYYRNSTGTNVQITSGSTINVSVVGGIGGDYASVGALLSFDDATDSYWLQQQGSPRPWAGMRVGNVDIYQQAASISNRIRLQSPAALAASYAHTFPGAITAGKVLQSDSSGVLSWSNVLTGAISSTSTVTGTDLLHTASSSTLIGPGAAVPQTSGGTAPAFNGTAWTVGVTTGALVYPFTATNGEVIVGWTFWFNKASATGTISATLYKMNMTTSVTSIIGVTQTTSAVSPGFFSLGQSSLTEAVAANTCYFISVSGGGVTGDIFYGCEVDRTRPTT